jgi:glutamate--cysteine ligase
MERHFDALGCAKPGKAMMSATAALQVNVDAGPAAQWSPRLRNIRALGPMLVAASSSSPYLGGLASGWHSMRQEAWHGIDHSRSDPVLGSEPTAAWASYALNAPVMLVKTDDEITTVTERVPFRAWLRGAAPFGRPPTLADLDYHLTTLFPPIRPRGYIEIRCVDALPDRWWPALAALTVTLIDDEDAAGQAAELCQPIRDSWMEAAHAGLADPAIRRAVHGCVQVAAQRCPPDLRPAVERFAELVESGRTPADELRARAAADGPLAVLEGEAHAC